MNRTDFEFECSKVAKFWGDKMPMMVMEECGELIQAISKFERNEKKTDSDAYKNLIDELGDISIAIMALQCHYWGLNGKRTIETLVNERIEKKLGKNYKVERPELYLGDYEDMTEEQYEADVVSDMFI